MKKSTKDRYLNQLYLTVLDWCEEGGEQDVDVIDRLLKYSELLKKEIPHNQYKRERATKREKELQSVISKLRDENNELKKKILTIQKTIKNIRSLV